MKAKIGIIGGGNMGTAIIGGIYRKYVLFVAEKDKKRCKYLSGRYDVTITDTSTLIQKSNVIILAVKPQNFDELLKEIQDDVTKDKLIISIAAGITIQYIEKRLGQNAKVIRTMPNLPAKVGMGMMAISRGKKATPNDLKTAVDIFNEIGESIIVNEKWLDAVTAVSGSGPAYVFLFLEVFMKAAQKCGFNKETSEQLVLQTIWGSLHLLNKQNVDPSILRERVTSKGGTTQAAMDIFKKKKLEQTFSQAIMAAKRQAKKLSK